MMGRRKHADLGRSITARYTSSSAPSVQPTPGDGQPRLNSAERFRFRRRPNATDALLTGTNNAGVNPQGLASHRADTKARIIELKRCYHGGIPDSWLANIASTKKADMVREGESRMWVRARQTAQQHRERHNASDGQVHPSYAPKSLTELATAAVGKFAATLNDTECHALIAAIPNSLRLHVMLEMIKNAARSQTSVSVETLRLLRSFEFENLDLSFLKVSREELCVLLSTRHNDTSCAVHEVQDDMTDHPDRNVLGDTWEDHDALQHDSCPLHLFRLGMLRDLDLSFCGLSGFGTHFVFALQRSLPKLQALYVAGCLCGEDGPAVAACLIDTLPALTVLDFGHNPLLNMTELYRASVPGALPLLHTLYVNSCPLVRPSSRGHVAVFSLQEPTSCACMLQTCVSCVQCAPTVLASCVCVSCMVKVKVMVCAGSRCHAHRPPLRLVDCTLCR
eukprot:m.807321 g.807321  ORF g.807321 m.807321 type:complete len:451 (-) comp23377_c0_seq66:4488-5840(-)